MMSERVKVKKGVLKKPAARTPYVRASNPVKATQLKVQKWSRKLSDFMGVAEGDLMKILKSDGFLPNWRKLKCPHCATPSLTRIGRPGRERFLNPEWRCANGACRARLYPQSFHPLFISGRNHSPMDKQVACLFLAVLGVQQNHAHVLLDLNDRVVWELYQNLKHLLKEDVEALEGDIKFGVRDAWPDVEVDEVTVAKRADGASEDKVVWDQFLGMQERGHPETLVVVPLPQRSTGRRSPGPGPLLLRVWKPIADSWLRDRNVVLQTDSARAYEWKLPGVVHASVVHQKKKVAGVWRNPKYIEHDVVTLPDNMTLSIVKGTQIIDGWWRVLRKEYGTASKNDSESVLLATRAAQWRHWHTAQDLWAATGAAVQRHFDRVHA